MLEGWHVLEPATTFIDGWHLDAICDHLTACTNGEIRNLIINIPPRCQKSLLACVFWFCHTWTFWPQSRWLYSAYSEILSTRDSVRCRRLIKSPWYQREFGSVFQLTRDQNAKKRFENDRTGLRLATGVGGVGTGEGGDFIIVDDPHKVQQGESDTVRRGVITWWTETMSTRGNNPQTAVRVIIMQRIHEEDLTGVVLARELGYEHLCLPMRYEVPAAGQVKRATCIGFSDPRTVDGELLWPEQFGETHVTQLENTLLDYGAAGQLQQRPAPRRGGMFQEEWFEIVEAAPVHAERVRYWDKAGTKENPNSARTAGVLMARTSDGITYVEDVVKGQWDAGDRERMIKQTAEVDAAKYGNRVKVWHEQEPGSGGKESAQSTTRNLAGFPVESETVSGDKVVRATPFAAQSKAGNVKIVRGEWNREFLQELTKFPNGKWKDQVDASSGAFNKLALKRGARLYSD
jgi:predicted phage terminase large subunit-like protein